MKKQLPTVILILVFLAGLSLLLYPTVSDYWNSFHQSRAIASYAQAAAELDDDAYERMRADAIAYNARLAQNGQSLTLSPQEQADYEAQLDVTGTGIMAYIEIPKIKCSLPIYHGTNEAVLQIAVGHLAGSSLPVGGAGTHCVLSAHRGLPSAKLFTRLDELAEGDTFLLQTLGETLTYEVDQILIVEPQEVAALGITEGGDSCTLVTCTPYGINTHRLLVRGHRVENDAQAKAVRVTADALQIEPLLVAPIAAIPLLVILLAVLLLTEQRNGSSRR